MVQVEYSTPFAYSLIVYLFVDRNSAITFSHLATVVRTLPRPPVSMLSKLSCALLPGQLRTFFFLLLLFLFGVWRLCATKQLSSGQKESTEQHSWHCLPHSHHVRRPPYTGRDMRRRRRRRRHFVTVQINIRQTARQRRQRENPS